MDSSVTPLNWKLLQNRKRRVEKFVGWLDGALMHLIPISPTSDAQATLRYVQKMPAEQWEQIATALDIKPPSDDTIQAIIDVFEIRIPKEPAMNEATEQPPPLTEGVPHIYQAMRGVSADLCKIGIAKERTNKEQNFQFRGIDQVMNVLAPLLVKHEMLILPSFTNRVVTQRTTKSGGTMWNVVLDASFQFRSCRDGSCLTVQTIGEAQDSGDKATNKAMAIAYKYAIFQPFCVPLEGEDDPDGHTPEESAAPQVASMSGTAHRVGKLSAAAGAAVAANDGATPTFTFRFGKHAPGKPEAAAPKDAEREYVEWYREAVTKAALDPTKARFKEANLAHAHEVGTWLLNANEPGDEERDTGDDIDDFTR